MHTEEDTFNALRRPSLHEMVELVSVMLLTNPIVQLYDLHAMIESNHWAVDDYIHAYNSYLTSY